MENPERQALVARVAHELETDGLFAAELADALAVVLQKASPPPGGPIFGWPVRHPLHDRIDAIPARRRSI